MVETEVSTERDVLGRLMAGRFSCRAYLPDAVSEEVIRSIVKMAGSTASWCNVQPWHLVVTSGHATHEIRMLLADAALRMKRKVTGLAPGTADQLLRYPWPGNVRELENAMERAVALARGSRIELEDLPEEVRHSLPTGSVHAGVRTLAEIEQDYILAVLAQNEGNQTRTAAQLHIGSATLYRKLKRYGRIGAARARGGGPGGAPA